MFTKNAKKKLGFSPKFLKYLAFCIRNACPSLRMSRQWGISRDVSSSWRKLCTDVSPLLMRSWLYVQCRRIQCIHCFMDRRRKVMPLAGTSSYTSMSLRLFSAPENVVCLHVHERCTVSSAVVGPRRHATHESAILARPSAPPQRDQSIGMRTP